MQGGDPPLRPPERDICEPLQKALDDSTASEAEAQQQTKLASAKTSLKAGSLKKRLKLIKELRLYDLLGVAGKGAFGVVYRATLRSDPTRVVAIKKTVFDPVQSTREIQILESLSHPNCLRLLQHFTETGTHLGQRTQVLIMDFVPFNLEKIITMMPKVPAYRALFVRNYAYQLCQAVEHLHAKSICHRDIKPANVLIDACGQRLVLGDFGSAKVIGTPGSKSTAYVCSRFYRAPELIVGSCSYGVEADMWSLGCVLAEMWTGEPLFRGENSKHQFIKIMEVCGTPNPWDLNAMSESVEVSLPSIQGSGLAAVLGPCDPNLADLIRRMLQYNPKERVSAREAQAHPFFQGVAPQVAGPGAPKQAGELIECLRCG